MNDLFIDKLKGRWQSIEPGPGTDFDRLRRSLVRRRVISAAMKGAELLLTLGAIAAGVYLATTLGGWLGWLSALMLVVILSWLFMWNYRVWRSALHWEDRGPEGTVSYACRNIESVLKSTRIMKTHCWSLGLFVIVLWGLQLSGLIHQARFLLTYTAISAAVVLILLLFLRRRQHRLRAELSSYRGMLQELQRD